LLACGLERLVEPDQDDGAGWRRSQCLPGPGRPGADRVDVWQAVEPRGDLPRLREQRPARALEHQDEALRVAEVLARQFGRRGRRGAWHDEVLSVQLALDTQAEYGKGAYDRSPGGQNPLRSS